MSGLQELLKAPINELMFTLQAIESIRGSSNSVLNNSDHTLLLITKGKMEVVIEGERISLSRGNMVMISANKSCLIQTADSVDGYKLSFEVFRLNAISKIDPLMKQLN